MCRLPSTICGLLSMIAAVGGCSVGGEYGAKHQMINYILPTGDTNGSVRRQLQAFLDLRCGPISSDNITPSDVDDDVVQFDVTGVRGCVLQGGWQWEMLTVRLSPSTKNRMDVSVEGWYAPGWKAPKSTSFSYMEPQYQQQVESFRDEFIAWLKHPPVGQ